MGDDMNRASTFIKTLLASGALSLFACSASLAQSCTQHELGLHLNFCKTDWGYHEGASCSDAALGINSGIPQQILGNSFKRGTTTQLAIGLAKAGGTEKAFEVMLCCQAHNGIGANCFKENKAQVINWMQTQ